MKQLLQQALDALQYHVEQTRPIEQTSQAISALESALAQQDHPAQAPAKQKFTKFDVLVITTAYEQGYGKGLQDRGVSNVYSQDSPAFHAWQLGYEEGQGKLASKSENTNMLVSQKPAETRDNWEPRL